MSPGERAIRERVLLLTAERNLPLPAPPPRVRPPEPVSVRDDAPERCARRLEQATCEFFEAVPGGRRKYLRAVSDGLAS